MCSSLFDSLVMTLVLSLSLSAPADQCVTMNGKYPPVNYQYSGNENLVCFDQAQMIPQLAYEHCFKNNLYSSGMSSKHELGHIDELFVWLDEEKGKGNTNSMPIDDLFAVNNYPDFRLLTPTMPELSFFA